MTGVVDRYAVIAEHLHYNPSFDVDSEDARIARAVSVHAGRDGYLDILSNSDPEAERERSESRMAEETVPTSEIVFETGGEWQQRNRLQSLCRGQRCHGSHTTLVTGCSCCDCCCRV